MEIALRPKSEIATKQEYLEIYSPKAMREAMKGVSTIQQAKALKTVSLAKIRKDIGSNAIEALIKIYLIQLSELLNLKRALTEDQIDEIASEVVATYYHLTMADVNLIMKRAKTGYYGELYEQLNMPKVMKWFADYFEERCELGERQSLDAHSQRKEYNDISRPSQDENTRNEFRKAKAHVDHVRLQARKNQNPRSS
ncbi:hypothetical protein [Reichenbachiella sp.]|uniref:hypothetical protein n=1 Tax=Reichenbachiella sp. TaxID=2184521 RepID=UPI003B58E6D4